MRSVSRRFDARWLARSFAHTLVPIGFAYVLAHYFSLLVWQGQAIGYLASNPLGHGTDYFGTAHWHVNYTSSARPAIWYVQVLALVAGHVGGLALAHDRALATYRSTAGGGPLAVLDARRDGRLHEPRAVAALGRQHLRRATIPPIVSDEQPPPPPSGRPPWLRPAMTVAAAFALAAIIVLVAILAGPSGSPVNNGSAPAATALYTNPNLDPGSTVPGTRARLHADRPVRTAGLAALVPRSGRACSPSTTRSARRSAR